MKCSIKKLRVFLLLALPLVILLQNPTGFPYPSPDAEFSDISISHYPNLLYLKQVLFDTGSIPLWSPAIMSGYPFAANPLSGLWYPPGWIALLLPLPFGMNLLAALHLLGGGFSFFYFLKSKGLSDYSAIFGALVYEFMPKLFAHYGAGHLTLMYAINWTPWLLWSTQKASHQRGIWYLVPPVILATICLADPRWVVYAGSLWLVYSIAHRQAGGREISPEEGAHCWARVVKTVKSVSVHLLRMIPQGVVAVLLSCPILVPLAQYTRLSTRKQMVFEDIFNFSLPPSRLLGLFFPDFGGNHELMVYIGIPTVTLVFMAILKKGKRPEERLWLWISFFTVVLALGSYIPLISYLTTLPVINLLRVPSRWLFLSQLAFATIAAYVVEDLLLYDLNESRRRIVLGLMGLVSFAWVLSSGIWVVTKEIPLNVMVGSLLILITSIWMVVKLRERIPARTWFMGLVLISLIDFATIDSSLVSFHPKNQVLEEQKEVGAYLAGKDGLFRVYSPSYSLPQHVAMKFGLELADGVDPLQLETYAEFMGKAAGVPRRGYQVTIPTFENGDPHHDNQLYTPDPLLLGLLNVRYVVSEFDINSEGLILDQRFGETRVYENLASLPRVWIQSDESTEAPQIFLVEVNSWKPNQISISASGPGILVLSEIMYPGWKAFIDEEAVEITLYYGILRSVPLPDGSHEVVFKYQPVSIALGIGLFIVGIIVSILLIRIRRESAGIGEGRIH